MTSTVFSRGSKWSASNLYDGWGDNITEEQIEALGDLVCDRFQELAGAAGSSAYWTPNTSEVIGNVYGQDTDEHSKWERPCGTTNEQLEGWREQAFSEVWAAVIGESNDADLCAKVAEIFKEVSMNQNE